MAWIENLALSRCQGAGRDHDGPFGDRVPVLPGIVGPVDPPLLGRRVRGPVLVDTAARQWRPSLVRAGLLGSVTQDGAGWVAAWSDEDGKRQRVRYATEEAAVAQVARRQFGGLRYHDLTLCDLVGGRRGAAEHGPAGNGPRTSLDHAGPLHPANRRRRPHLAGLDDAD